MLLAIDTATEFAGLALYNQDTVWAEEIWHAARNHTVELMPRLNRMLDKANLQIADLQGIAVCIGPGSYTGVRIGVAVAKGLALPQNLPTVGISTLDVTAYPHAGEKLPVVAVAAAGRKRVLVATYKTVRKVWKAITPPALMTLTELAQHLTKPSLIAGEIKQTSFDLLKQHAMVDLKIVSPIHRIRRPAVLAELAWQKLQANQPELLNNLSPIYIKDP